MSHQRLNAVAGMVHFGKQTKVVRGIMESVSRELPHANAQKHETYVVARYDLGGGVKRWQKLIHDQF